ncbi:MAG: FxLYD domain-containing protein [Aerococcus sp.]|nr:FxLYD domain-containing protein [Aerococcus sp.]
MKSLFKRLALIVVGAFILTACSATPSVDDKFFSDLQAMWTERTKTLIQFQKEQQANSGDSSQEKPSTQDILKKTYNDEWNSMKGYEGKDLKDDKLNQNVKNYLTALKACHDALDGDLTIEKNKTFNENYNKRVKALNALAEDPRFTLPKNQLNDLHINDDTIKQYEEQAKKTKAASEQLKKDLEAIKLNVSKQPTTDDPTVTWSGELTNHSDMEVQNLNLSFNLLDKDDKTLDSPKVKIEKLSPGETKKFSISSKELNFDHMQVGLDDQLKIVEPGSTDNNNDKEQEKSSNDSADKQESAQSASEKK